MAQVQVVRQLQEARRHGLGISRKTRLDLRSERPTGRALALAEGKRMDLDAKRGLALSLAQQDGQLALPYGCIEGKPLFYDYATRKIKKRTNNQDKADKSKAMEAKSRSEKGHSSKDQDAVNGQESKKQGDKLSDKTIDPVMSVDSKTTESKTKISYIRELRVLAVDREPKPRRNRKRNRRPRSR